jgi:hypothetical protein
MKTWKNRRRSKKHTQRGGEKYNVSDVKPKVDTLLQLRRFSDPVPADIDLKVKLNTLKQKLDTSPTPTIDLKKDDITAVNLEYDKLTPEQKVMPPPAAAPLPRAGQPVYALNAPAATEGQPKTIADCNRMLAEARARISALEGSLAEETARLAGVTAERRAEIARLGENIAARQAEVEAAGAAIEALRGEKGDIEAELGRIRTELAEKLGELAETSAINRELADANSALTAAGVSKDNRLAVLERLPHDLDALRAFNQAAIIEKDAEIQQIRQEHGAELIRVREQYGAEAKVLREKVDRLDTEAKGTAAEKRQVEEQKAGLQVQLGALKEKIDALTKDLTASQEETSKQAKEKAEAAEAARKAAAVESEKLQRATSQGLELRERLAAAQRANEASDKAANEAKAAQQAAAAAAEAANRQIAAATADAERAREAAAASNADKEASEREKQAAQAAAEQSELARAAAEREAAARAAEATTAKDSAAAAEATRSQVQAKLDALERSVPTILSITGEAGAGDVVGGAGGRPAVYGELLTVTWNRGADERNTWVFAMFADKVPVYSQLVLNDKPFTFTSTVSGPVQAVVYDVVAHSRGNGEGLIDF